MRPRQNETDTPKTGAAIPERCTKAAFARLLGVDAANVSRWVSWQRIELDDAGRVLVRPSLTRLLLTTDPSRGGRGAMRGEGSGGTIDRARQLLERAGAAPVDRVAKLEHQLAEALAQLEVERRFRAERCYTHDEEARLRCQLLEALAAQWGQLTAAREADRAEGGEAFERLLFRIECRIYSGMSPEEIELDEVGAFGPPLSVCT